MFDTSENERGSVGTGVVLTLFLHLLVLALSMGFAHLWSGDATAGFSPFAFIGVLQILWMWPACFVAAHFKHRRTLRGLGIGALITFLLNAACAGIVFTQFL